MAKKKIKSNKGSGDGFPKFVGAFFPTDLQAALERCARAQRRSVSSALRCIVEENSEIKEALRQSRTP